MKFLGFKKGNRKKDSKIGKFVYPVILSAIVGAVCFFVGRQIGLNTDTSSTKTEIKEEKVYMRDITKTLSASGEIVTALSENLDLTEDYYFSKVYVEEGDTVSKGEVILAYTNGEQVTAPYDLVVDGINVPISGEVIDDTHYVSVQKTSDLRVNIQINDSEISNIEVGQEVEITLNADSSKVYTGNIKKINSIGSYSSSGSTYTVQVNLKNDGSIRLGMSASCSITIETKTDVIAVPVAAVMTDEERYVVVIKDGEEENVTVTTGISDGDYVEITSGLNGGETIKITTTTTESTKRSSSNSNSGFGGGGNMPGGDFDPGSMFGGDFGGGGFDPSNMPSGGGSRPGGPGRDN